MKIILMKQEGYRI